MNIWLWLEENWKGRCGHGEGGRGVYGDEAGVVGVDHVPHGAEEESHTARHATSFQIQTSPGIELVGRNDSHKWANFITKRINSWIENELR